MRLAACNLRRAASFTNHSAQFWHAGRLIAVRDPGNPAAKRRARGPERKTMAQRIIVAQFNDHGAARRAFCELLTSGVQPQNISLIAGDGQRANRDFGILADDADLHIAAVRSGATLLAVRADDAMGERIAQIIFDYSPTDIAERRADHALGIQSKNTRP